VPQKRSTKKRLRQNEKLNARNKAIKSRVATAIKRAQGAPPEERAAAVRKAFSAIDKAVKAGVIRKQTASRKKASLAKAAPTAG
jgi:small subunit ribosomal protein S20